MRCDLCGRSVPTKAFTLASGQSIGESCGDECGALLWAGHMDRITDAPLHERALTAWQIRRRAAAANGRPFSEPQPKSPAERELDNAIAAHGFTDAARELA